MPVIEEPQADGQVVRRYVCDRCGAACREEDRPIHLGHLNVAVCRTCQQEGGSWLLWYDLRDEQRRGVGTEHYLVRSEGARLQSDPHVLGVWIWFHHRHVATSLVVLRPGHTAPEHPDLQGLDRQRRVDLAEILGVEPSHRRVRDILAGVLQEQVPEADLDLRRGSTTRTLLDAVAQRMGGISRETRDQLIQAALSTAEGRSRLAQAMITPIMARREANLAARLFPVQPLPDGALPIYSEADDPDRNRWVGIEWPTWAVEGATVYHREAGYQAFRITEVLPGSLKLSEIDPPNDSMTLHIVYHDAENLDREWTPVIPPTAWERLLRDDP
jgi:hypothetical protein